MIFDVAIVGGGAAGLMAAVFAGQAGGTVCVIERNTALGRKLLKTGGGRCNLTHQGTIDELVRTFGFCGRFLKHALYTFSPQAVIDFFAAHHLTCKTEKDGCVFPITDRAADICRILQDDARRHNVQYLYGKHVERIDKTAEGFSLTAGGQTLAARTVIIATGGVSWPQTGSDGDGLRFAEAFGHTIEPLRASVCPVIAQQTWVRDLQGVALDNVVLRAEPEGKKIAAHGAMVFTGNGLGGFAAMDLSREITDTLHRTQQPVEITMDLLPALDAAAVDVWLVKQCAANARRETAAIVTQQLPRALAIKLTEWVEPSHPIQGGQLKKEQRRKLVELIKTLPLTITGLAPLTQATITRGGVALDEIDPKTMQSLKCEGLFFAGEAINADGPCGGYNLQIAWSTGALAGQSAAKKN